MEPGAVVVEEGGSAVSLLSTSTSREKAALLANDAPPREATWSTTANLIISDIIGIGVLSLAAAFADLGWVLGVVFAMLFLPFNIYCGLLVWRTNIRVWPDTVTYAGMARKAGGDRFAFFVAVTVYAFMVSVLGAYTLTIGLTLSGVFYDFDLCFPLWVFLGIAGLWPLAQWVRTLNETRMALWANTSAIVVAVSLALGKLVLVVDGDEAETLTHPNGTQHLVAANLTWSQFVSGLSKFSLAYLGVILYLELMAEMKQPRDFPKALAASAPLQGSLYMIVGCVGYAYIGDTASGLLTDEVPPSPVYRAASLFLYLYMNVAYLVKGTIVARAIHSYAHPSTLNDTSRRGKTIWMVITTSLLVTTFLIACSVPFFEDLVDLIGALFCPVLGFSLPVVFYVLGRKAKGERLAMWEWLVHGATFTFGILLCGFGTVSAVINIVDEYDSVGLPFEC